MLPEFVDKSGRGLVVVCYVGEKRRFTEEQKRTQQPDRNSAVEDDNKRDGAALIHKFAVLFTKQKHDLRQQ